MSRVAVVWLVRVMLVGIWLSAVILYTVPQLRVIYNW